MTKLIFVEGLQGCGKSTLSRFVSEEIARLNLRSIWCKEEAEHPVGLHYNADKYSGVGDYMETASARWSSFAAEACKTDQVTVMDGRLVMCPVWGLLRQDIEEGRIRSFVSELADASSPLDPVVIYLHSPDYPAVLAAMCQRRGRRTEGIYIARQDKSPYAKRRGLHGYEGLLRFWLEHKEITERVVGGLYMPKLSIDMSGQQWETYREQVMEFLAPHLGMSRNG